ncbi:RNA-directed DNA polymerase [Paraburkholderia metrosideri]|uniref:RNA-directed DNA polymerase n=1 Tax=Paraburkholderia metrosideri TaxID=580937 RepID=UPI0019186B82|nr:RNA-directed DNA polymerase [Paraburkholderia metrosideri]
MNATKTTYFPSYVGVRLIASQLGDENGAYLERMIVRRLRALDSWRYRPFKLYKGSINRQGEPEHIYRDCWAPSPSTSIGEAVILALLASDPAFAVPDRVFSYRWPKSISAGGSYEYFAEGYMRRNKQIAAALGEGMVAIVMDIKSFYPSVSAEVIEPKLKARLTSKNSILSGFADEILNFFRGLMNAGGAGIPIGPESAHVLGHLVLEPVDNELTELFGIKYFRYVDDIVVIANEADRKYVEKKVESTLRKYGFEPNTDKTTALDAQSWDRHISRPDIASNDSFRAFARDLTTYLAFHPDRSRELKVAFSAAGMSIPITRLLATSRYSRFRYFLRHRKSNDNLSKTLSIWLSNNASFIERAIQLKADYEATLAKLIQEPYQDEPSLRRWQVQRVRRLVNALFYLRDFGSWQSGALADSFPELIEQHALAEALGSGRVDPVLPFYGRGAAAFAELWAEYGHGTATFDRAESALTSAELESVVSLQLSGILTDVGSWPVAQHPQARLMRIVSRDQPERRSDPDLSFEDELESLRLRMSNDHLAQLARSRYSLTESTALDALALSSSEYRS